MFWQKIHHHFTFFFFAILVLVQGLIFVVSKANPAQDYDFKAVLINPLSQSSHQIGEQINLQIQLNESKIDNNTVVYFVVASPEKNIKLNFEASRQADGSWQANNSWNTENWPAGIYQLSAVANIFDKNGVLLDTLNSDINLVQLLDINSKSTSVTASEAENQEVVISQIDENQALAVDGHATSTTSTSTVDVINEEPVVEPSVPTTTTRTITLSSFNLTVPSNNTLFGTSQLALKLTTNFAADNLNIELINVDSTAISTGDIKIDKLDGLSWNKTINLDETFIAGNYKLLVTAKVADSETTVDDSFDLALVLPTILKASDVSLSLFNPGNNLSGLVTLKATSDKNLNNLQFVFQESVARAEVLQADGVLQSSNAGGGQQYIYLFDTKQLENGNYYVLVQSLVGDTMVSSEAKIISIYNEILVGESSTSTETLATSTDNVSDPLLAGTSTETNNINCLKSGITDQQLCSKYQAGMSGQIPVDCLDQNIFEAVACENYLRDNKLQALCQAQGLAELNQCQDYLASQYLAKVDCKLATSEECQAVLRQKYLYRLSSSQIESKKIEALAESQAAKTIKLKDLLQELSTSEESNWNLPLLKVDTNILVAKAKPTAILVNAEQLLLNNPAALLLDRDADLLPDDLEAYYGTDSANPDSDGDTYLDGEEIRNGYNPIGDGKLEVERNALDQAVLAKIALEQPHDASLLIDPIWQLKQVETETAGLSLSGTADPNTWVNIYLYSSMPLVLSTKTDASGSWNYRLDQTLSEGLHKVYVASNDSSGNLLKQSSAISFEVTNITREPVANNETASPAKVATQKFWEKLPFNIYYVGGGVFILIFIIGIILLLRRSRKIAEEAMVENSIPLDNQNNPQV